MKKSLKIMAALVLISSVVGPTSLVNSVVNAEELAVSTNENIDLIRADLERLVAKGQEILADPGLLTAASIARLTTAVSEGQHALDNNLEANYSSCVGSLNDVIATLEYTDDSSSTDSSSTDSSSTDSSSTDSSSTDSSSTDSSSTDSSSTDSSSTDSSSTDSSSTDASSTYPSSTDSTSTYPSSTDSTSSEVAKPSIEVSDQTAYVGQTLTEDIILGWANFKNADGLTVGFEVVGEQIQVTALGSKLVETGTHKIRFYISSSLQQRSVETVVAEKEITLTVLPESDNPLNPKSPVEETKAPTTDNISPIASPVPTTAKKSIDSGRTTANQLPRTGETNNNMMIASSGVLLIAGAYIFRKKQLEK